MNPSEGETPQPIREPAMPPPIEPGILFLCEDSEDDEFWFKKTSRKAGLTAPIHVVSTVREAIGYLRETCQQGRTLPRLMVLDFRLSDGKCTEVLDFVRTEPRLQNTPIITYSGGLNKADLQSTAKYGVVACFEKPLTPEHVDRFRPYFA